MHIFFLKGETKFEKNVLLCFSLFLFSFQLSFFQVFPFQSLILLLSLCNIWDLQKGFLSLPFCTSRWLWGLEHVWGWGVGQQISLFP